MRLAAVGGTAVARAKRRLKMRRRKLVAGCFLDPMRELKKQVRIVGALILRELVTRYGREGLGFLWLVLEPLVFCFGVMGMWTLIKPEYEHGIRLGPFIMTGYMSILVFRHVVGISTGALQANIGLMQHRIVRPLHIYAARTVMEFIGCALAFLVVYVVLLAIEWVEPPQDYLKLYSGYLLMGWVSVGFALTISSLAIRYEVIERVLPVSMYLIIPLSGAFFMMDWIPPGYREILLLNPLPHTIEMVRDGVFGEFVKTHYNPVYPLAFGGVMTFVGLLMLAQARRYVEVE
ncbi:ABC transporter permease [Brevundimonas sp. VNH65]|uniref:ABC transporter permease n=1 Tax=Brevundimonas sp. VNH65 TaxID=3400917 RepID=UPI003C0D9782